MILPAPMLLHEGRKSPPFAQDSGWLYEIKYDGYRLVAGVNDSQVRLNTKSGADATRWFPEIVEGLCALPGGPHVIDGEVCCLDSIGKSDFDRLHARAQRRRWFKGCDEVVFCAFDLLARDGRSLIGFPLEERKRQLAELLKVKPSSVLNVGHFDAKHGATLYSQAVALGLEGVVAKRLGSHYRPGERSLDWVKCKVPGAVPAKRFRRA